MATSTPDLVLDKQSFIRKRTTSTDWTKLEAGGSASVIPDFEPELSKLSESPFKDQRSVSITATAVSADEYFPVENKHSLRKRLLLSKLTARTPVLFFLATGTSVTLAAQAVTDLDIADGSVQILALAKFASTAAVCQALRRRQQPRAVEYTRQCKVLMLGLGLLDVVGYATFAAGLPLCGAAESSMISAATNQLLTALLSWTVLGRHLSRGQLMSLLLVVCGLALRSAGFSREVRRSATGSEVTGVLLTLISSLAFSVMNILYEHLLRTEKPAPQQSDITEAVAWTGLLCNALFFAVACWPRYDVLVTQHAAGSGVSAVAATGAVALFAAVYNLHVWAQGQVMQADGALGVGLVNVVRGSTVTLVAGSLSCALQRPRQCLSLGALGSAAVVTAGGLLWVLSSAAAPEPLSESAAKLARAASGKIRRSMSLRADL